MNTPKYTHKQHLLVGKLVGESEDVVLAATQNLQRMKMKSNHKAASCSGGGEQPNSSGCLTFSKIYGRHRQKR